MLLAPIWLRTAPVTAPPEDLRIVQASPALPARVGGFTRTGLWQLSSPSLEFGGYSALLALQGGYLRLFSDRGTRLTLAIADGRPARPKGRRVHARVWDMGPFSHFNPDIESATRDPATGDYWLGFEGFNAIARYDVASTLIAARQPPEMRHWPVNGGAEAMVRLADGRFLVLPEQGGPGLLFPGDPTGEVAGQTFSFRLPDPYHATDIAALPDGRVLVLARGLKWGRPPFTARLYLGDLADLVPGREWPLRKVLDLDALLPRENWEGLYALPQEDGSLVMWLVSDDNRALLQRTLLARLEWRP